MAPRCKGGAVPHDVFWRLHLKAWRCIAGTVPHPLLRDSGIQAAAPALPPFLAAVSKLFLLRLRCGSPRPPHRK